MPRLPTFIEPCSPKAAKTPPKGEDWVFEAKWDRYRCLIVKDGKEVRLYSRKLPQVGHWRRTGSLPSQPAAAVRTASKMRIRLGVACAISITVPGWPSLWK